MPTAVGASNAWVVSPARTATGRPILCNDPHLEPSVPSIWFAAHVRAGDDFETTGVTLAGQPFPIIGHNRRIAWGYTNSFVTPRISSSSSSTRPPASASRTERGWAESRIAREVIRVKDRPDEVEEVVITTARACGGALRRHGHGPLSLVSRCSGRR